MASTAYDHQLQVGSTTYSLKLATDTNGKALYSVSEDLPSYNQVLEVAQKNWTGGHGQYEYVDNQMYFSGQAIDTTQEGRIILGPNINQVYSSATSTKQEYLDATLDNRTAVYGANYQAQTFTPAAGHSILSAKLYLLRTGNPGTLTLGVYATAAGKPTGSALTSTTYNGNTITNTGSGEWVTFIFTTTVALTISTQYALVLSNTGGNTTNNVGWGYDSTSPGYAGGTTVSSADSGATWTIVSGTDYLFEEWATAATELSSSPTCFHWSTTNKLWLCADSAKIFIYTGGIWLPATTTVSGVVAFASYNGKDYAACGSGDNFWYSTDDDTWTECTLTDHHAIKFLSAPNTDGTANTFWKLMTTNELTYSANPVNAGTEFSSPAYIGDTSSNVTNVFLCGDELAVGRQDNLYHYDSNGGIHAKMNELQNQRSSENFKYVQNWQSSTYFSLVNGVGEITGNLSSGVYNKISPLLDTGDIDKVGVCKGITADTDYLYVAMLEGTTTHIYKGKPTSNGWTWCPLVYLGANGCETIAVAQHSATDRRLWFGYGTHTGYVQISDNPTADDNARFTSSGWIKMSYVYGSNPYWDKMIQSLVLELDSNLIYDVGSVTYITGTVTPSVYTLASGWTTETAQSLYGVNKVNLASPVSGKKIGLTLTLATTDSRYTPQVRCSILKGHEKPALNRVHNCTYLVGEDKSHRTKTVRDILRSLRTTTTLIKFADCIYGEEVTKTGATAGTDYHYVVMLPGYPRETEVIQSKGQQPELAIECRFMEVL